MTTRIYARSKVGDTPGPGQQAASAAKVQGSVKPEGATTPPPRNAKEFTFFGQQRGGTSPASPFASGAAEDWNRRFQQQEVEMAALKLKLEANTKDDQLVAILAKLSAPPEEKPEMAIAGR